MIPTYPWHSKYWSSSMARSPAFYWRPENFSQSWSAYFLYFWSAMEIKLFSNLETATASWGKTGCCRKTLVLQRRSGLALLVILEIVGLHLSGQVPGHKIHCSKVIITSLNSFHLFKPPWHSILRFRFPPKMGFAVSGQNHCWCCPHLLISFNFNDMHALAWKCADTTFVTTSWCPRSFILIFAHFAFIVGLIWYHSVFSASQ